MLEETCGLAAARVDDHHPPAAPDDASEHVADAGRREQAALGDERVGADHEEEAGASQVRDWHQQRRSVEQGAGGEAVVDVLAARLVVAGRAEGVHETA